MSHLRSGDWLLLIVGAGFVFWLGSRVWFSQPGETLVVRSAGRVVSELPLARDRVAIVPGPLGTTEIEIYHLRARIRADPGPRQYCVKQGWINHAGQSAICLPNQVSIEIGGTTFDSLNY